MLRKICEELPGQAYHLEQPPLTLLLLGEAWWVSQMRGRWGNWPRVSLCQALIPWDASAPPAWRGVPCGLVASPAPDGEPLCTIHRLQAWTCVDCGAPLPAKHGGVDAGDGGWYYCAACTSAGRRCGACGVALPNRRPAEDPEVPIWRCERCTYSVVWDDDEGDAP
jgi:hypothetical protein